MWMFSCGLKQLSLNSVQGGSCCCVSFINRRLSPHTEHHTVTIVPGPAEKLWTLRNNPAIITQYHGWSSGKPKRNFLGMFFPLTARVTWNQSKSCFINSEKIKNILWFFFSVVFLAWNVNELKNLPDWGVKPVENTSKLLFQSAFLPLQDLDSLLYPFLPHTCTALCPSWSCFLFTQSCVPVHTETREHIPSPHDPKVMCWLYLLANWSLGFGGKLRHFHRITAQSHAVCSLCECLCVAQQPREWNKCHRTI